MIFALLLLLCPFFYNVYADTADEARFRLIWLFGVVGVKAGRRQGENSVFFLLFNIPLFKNLASGKLKQKERGRKKRRVKPKKTRKKARKPKKSAARKKTPFKQRWAQVSADIKNIADYPHKERLLAQIRLCLKRLFAQIKPENIFLSGEASIGAPHLTGYFLALESVCVSCFKLPINIKGRFDGGSNYFKLKVSGKLWLLPLFISVLALALKNPARSLLAKLLFAKNKENA